MAVKACLYPQFKRCLGWNDALGAVQCGVGYLQGSPGCLGCAQGYYARTDGACVPCGADRGDVLAILRPMLLFFACLLAAGCTMFVLIVLIQRRHGGTLKSGLRRAMQWTVSAFVTLQTISAVGNGSSALPSFMRSMFQLLDVFNFNFPGVNAACLSRQPGQRFLARNGLFIASFILMAALCWLLYANSRQSQCSSRSSSSSPSSASAAARLSAFKLPGLTGLTASQDQDDDTERPPNKPSFAQKVTERLLSLVTYLCAIAYSPLVAAVWTTLYCIPTDVTMRQYAALLTSAGETPPSVPAARANDVINVRLLASDSTIVCGIGPHAISQALGAISLVIFVVAYPVITFAWIVRVLRARLPMQEEGSSKGLGNDAQAGNASDDGKAGDPSAGGGDGVVAVQRRPSTVLTARKSVVSASPAASATTVTVTTPLTTTSGLGPGTASSAVVTTPSPRYTISRSRSTLSGLSLGLADVKVPADDDNDVDSDGDSDACDNLAEGTRGAKAAAGGTAASPGVQSSTATAPHSTVVTILSPFQASKRLTGSANKSRVAGTLNGRTQAVRRSSALALHASNKRSEPQQQQGQGGGSRGFSIYAVPSSLVLPGDGSGCGGEGSVVNPMLAKRGDSSGGKGVVAAVATTAGQTKSQVAGLRRPVVVSSASAPRRQSTITSPSQQPVTASLQRRYPFTKLITAAPRLFSLASLHALAARLGIDVLFGKTGASVDAASEEGDQERATSHFFGSDTYATRFYMRHWEMVVLFWLTLISTITKNPRSRTSAMVGYGATAFTLFAFLGILLIARPYKPTARHKYGVDVCSSITSILGVLLNFTVAASMGVIVADQAPDADLPIEVLVMAYITFAACILLLIVLVVSFLWTGVQGAKAEQLSRGPRSPSSASAEKGAGDSKRRMSKRMSLTGTAHAAARISYGAQQARSKRNMSGFSTRSMSGTGPSLRGMSVASSRGLQTPDPQSASPSRRQSFAPRGSIVLRPSPSAGSIRDPRGSLFIPSPFATRRDTLIGTGTTAAASNASPASMGAARLLATFEPEAISDAPLIAYRRTR